MKVKYREISKEMRKIAAPDNLLVKVSSQRSSLNTSIDVVEHYNIDVKRLIPYSKQARQNFDEVEIKGLAQSIKEHGIRQPLSVILSEIQPTFYEVVSGERRLRAAKSLGISKVPCIILSDHLLAEEIALVENIQRQNLSPIEMGEAFSKILIDRPGLKQIELSQKLGVPHKLISECIRFSQLPESVKTYLIKNNIQGRDFLRKILKSEDPAEFIRNIRNQNKFESLKKLSVMRITLEEGSFLVQDKQVATLSDNEKIELKKILISLYEKI